MSRRAHWPVVLTIAGSDPSGGAGVQADLKVFAALEVYGAAALTAITIQDTTGVRAVHPVDAEVVAAQLAAVLGDLPVAGAKTGMLATAGAVHAVAAAFERHPETPLVVDPVLATSGGFPLLDASGIDALLKRLVPLASLLTPNLEEAERLAGCPGDGAEAAAARLIQRGARAVLVTGGEGPGQEAVDLLATTTGRRAVIRPRLATSSTHGTGCALSAAIAAWLARGAPLDQAVDRARDYLQKALVTAWPLGKGHGPPHHLHPFWKKG